MSSNNSHLFTFILFDDQALIKVIILKQPKLLLVGLFVTNNLFNVSITYVSRPKQLLMFIPLFKNGNNTNAGQNFRHKKINTFLHENH